MENLFQLCSGITRGRVFNGELYAERFQKLILRLFKLFHENLSLILKLTIYMCKFMLKNWTLF